VKFTTAVWIDAETENWCARIFPDFGGIDLTAWGLTGDVPPIDIVSSSWRLLAHVIEDRLNSIVPDFPMSHFEPYFLGKLYGPDNDIRALLTEKVAAEAA